MFKPHRGKKDCPICGNTTSYLAGYVCKCNRCEQFIVPIYDSKSKRYILHDKKEFTQEEVDKIIENERKEQLKRLERQEAKHDRI